MNFGIEHIIAGVGIGGVVVSTYLTLRLDKLIVDKLNGRYVREEVCKERTAREMDRVSRLERQANGVDNS